MKKKIIILGPTSNECITNWDVYHQVKGTKTDFTTESYQLISKKDCSGSKGKFRATPNPDDSPSILINKSGDTNSTYGEII